MSENIYAWHCTALQHWLKLSFINKVLILLSSLLEWSFLPLWSFHIIALLNGLNQVHNLLSSL